jgi:hypothetical protein
VLELQIVMFLSKGFVILVAVSLLLAVLCTSGKKIYSESIGCPFSYEMNFPVPNTNKNKSSSEREVGLQRALATRSSPRGQTLAWKRPVTAAR